MFVQPCLKQLFGAAITLILGLTSVPGNCLNEASTPQVALLSLKPDYNFRETVTHSFDPISGLESSSAGAILTLGDPFKRNETIELKLHPLDDEEWKTNFLSVTHYLVTNTERLGLFKVHFQSVLAERTAAQRRHAEIYHPDKTYHDLIMNYTTVYACEDNSTVLLITRLGNYLEVYGLINDHIEITPLWRRNPRKVIKPGKLISRDSNELLIFNKTLLHRIVDHGPKHSRSFKSKELIRKIKILHKKRNDKLFKSVLNNHPILDNFPIMRPEVSMFIDSYEYDNLGRNIDAVWRYCVIFFTRISLIFKQIPNPTIELHLKNILVATKPFRFQEVIPDFRSFQPDSYHSYLNAMRALKEFGTVFNLEESVLDDSDLILVATGQDLCLDSQPHWIDSCSYSTVRGQAFVGGACQKNLFQTQKMNVAIIEDSGYFDGVHTAAHEMGHLLGAVHDGEWPLSTILGPGGRGCTSADGNLMSNGQGRRGKIGDDKSFEFSLCSEEQFQYYSELPQAMCLYSRPMH